MNKIHLIRTNLSSFRKFITIKFRNSSSTPKIKELKSVSILFNFKMTERWKNSFSPVNFCFWFQTINLCWNISTFIYFPVFSSELRKTATEFVLAYLDSNQDIFPASQRFIFGDVFEVGEKLSKCQAFVNANSGNYMISIRSDQCYFIKKTV